MEPNSILLVTITVFVALMTIGLWGILFALVKAHTGTNAERNAAVRSISEECAEAEKVLSSSAAKAMNAHSLKSALLPKIEKIQKMLFMNMSILDVYFVKYMETRLSAFQAAFAESGPGRLFPIDKFLTEPKPAAPFIEAMPAGPAPRETAFVNEKAGEEPFEPPAIDLRTGVITVAQEEPVQAKPVERKPAVAGGREKPATPLIKKPPAKTPKKKAEQKAPVAEEEFDFEKEIAANVEMAIQADLGQGAISPFGRPGEVPEGVDVSLVRDFQRSDAPPPFGDGEAPDTKELHTEKTMRWDKEELTGMAGKPESIVVEGADAETAKANTANGRNQTTGTPDATQEQAMISGEDIESTLDSFFGLGDK
jgi:hypothetical protein